MPLTGAALTLEFLHLNIHVRKFLLLRSPLFGKSLSVLSTITDAHEHLSPKCLYVKHSQLIILTPKGTFR